MSQKQTQPDFKNIITEIKKFIQYKNDSIHKRLFINREELYNLIDEQYGSRVLETEYGPVNHSAWLKSIANANEFGNYYGFYIDIVKIF